MCTTCDFFFFLQILEKLTKQEGIASKSEVAKSVLGKLYIFVVMWNLYVFLGCA